MIWKFRGNKWINNYFDLLKSFYSNLNNFYKKSDEYDRKIDNLDNFNFSNGKDSINKISNVIKPVNYYITVITCHPKNLDVIFAGDNKGNIYQFDSELSNSPKKFVVGNFGISHIKFSNSGEYLSVGFKVGNVVLLDYNNLCKFCFLVEDLHNDDYFITERERKKEILSFGSIMTNNLEFYGSKSYNTISKFSETAGNSIKILSMSSYKSLRMQMIKKSVVNYNSNYGNFSGNFEQGKSRLGGSSQNYFSTLIKNYEYNFNIKNIELHNSEQYVIILFDNNSVIINRLEPNYISGIISLNNSFLEFYDIKLDPSGLYIAILSDAYTNPDIIDSYLDENVKSNQNFNNIKSNGSNKFEEGNKNNFVISNGKYNTESTKNNYNILPLTEVNFIKESVRKRSSIILYEIGTGNFVSILKNLFLISNYKFSNDGRFLCIAAESGCVTIWNTCGEVRENIFSVLEESKINNRFWDNIRIDFLQDDYNNTRKFQRNIEKDEKNEKIEEIKLTKKFNNLIEEKTEKNNNNYNTMKSSSKNKEKLTIIKPSIQKSVEKNSSSRSHLNKARISQSSAKNDTSCKSIYLNYENTLNNGNNNHSYENASQKYSNSNNINSNKFNSSGKDMIYSFSNLYKKKDLNESRNKLKNNKKYTNDFNNENIYNSPNTNNKREPIMIKSNFDYLIQNDANNNEFSQVVFPEPDDIDNLEDNKYNNLINDHRKEVNYDIDSNDSRNKMFNRENTSDQIEFIDNKIGKFEKMIGGKEKNSSIYNTPKGFSSQTDYMSGDSIDN